MVKAPEWRDERKLDGMKEESVDARKVCIFSFAIEDTRAEEETLRRAASFCSGESVEDIE